MNQRGALSATARGVASDAEAAFLAGAALTSLDNLVRAEPVWAGAWRQRQALKCAAATVRLVGRTEDEAALRDAVRLARPGDDVGPAGNILVAWRRLASKSPAVDVGTLAGIVDLLGRRLAAAPGADGSRGDDAAGGPRRG